MMQELISVDWVDICAADDVPVGEMFSYKNEGNWIVIYHVEDGFFATNNVCPHAFALLSDGFLEDECIECPLHGALFNIKTGAVERGPAESPVKTYKVKLEGGRLYCAVPTQA